MAIPTPSLDDRTFQQIVDKAKALIPTYCPEWTDHNVSDPGIALIELFAWMTEMLLYRVNQVPDKMYVKFLELIGITLEPPRAATAPITFYLSGPQPTEVTIREGTEVATIRTETTPAIVFSTEADLIIRPVSLAAAFTRNVSHSGADAWTAHNLRQLELPNQRIPVFPPQPSVGDSFYLALEHDHSHHVLALVLDCSVARGAGVDPKNPPLQWQVWSGEVTHDWAPCELEFDGTGGFNYAGEVILRTPAMVQRQINQRNAYGLRCRLTDAQRTEGYRVSPEIKRLRLESRGGTVNARHAITIRDEVLGRSEGIPGQVFKLRHSPVLARDKARDRRLIVEIPAGEKQHWLEVDDFADSGPSDRHFTLDNIDGTLVLGPRLLQRDASVYQFGAVPPKDSLLRFERYQHGGGVAGNVPAGALSVMKSSVPYVARITNWTPAQGGQQAQSLEDAKLRVPQRLRTRNRAVTADDFEYLACQVPGIARAKCLGAQLQPDSGYPRPGEVVVAVLPDVDETVRHKRIEPGSLVLSDELRRQVLSSLEARRVLGAKVNVDASQYYWVSVEATVHVSESTEHALMLEVQQRAEDALYRYLNPFTGAPSGRGWPFGRGLHVSEIHSVLQAISGVEFVEEVRVHVRRPGRDQAEPVSSRLVLPPGALICSDPHQLKVLHQDAIQ